MFNENITNMHKGTKFEGYKLTPYACKNVSLLTATTMSCNQHFDTFNGQ